jgi:hypothetical protein
MAIRGGNNTEAYYVYTNKCEVVAMCPNAQVF